MSSQTIVRLSKLSSQRAGIGHLSVHDLRRTHITLALAGGAPLQDMQAQAGHADPSTWGRSCCEPENMNSHTLLMYNLGDTQATGPE